MKTLGPIQKLSKIGKVLSKIAFILTLVIPTGCAFLGSIAEGLIAGFLHAEEAAAMELYFESGASVVLGIMLMLGALLCRYGAEAAQREDA